MMRSIGFIKFDPNGVDAANIISPTTSPTIRHTASGPLVINPVIVPMPFVFLRHSITISIEIAIKNISTITPKAPAVAKVILPLLMRALPQKKTMTKPQEMRSR